ncbi:MAG: TIGR03619 family F420-dependent LLM class oxidoreductase [Gammaproteobacteria bacterium]|nr:TIGR03619 family F420-dependent LLM class oxidoreductase [Gammaproteobacteria bacterium]
MKFWQFLRFAPPEMLPRLAQVAEDAGFHGVMLVDHMFVPEQLDTTGTLYSAREDGKPFWGAEDPWPDPWAAIGAMAAVTSRLEFSTCIYILPLRNPFDVAKSMATLSVVSGNRVALGCGAGWMKEEYAAMGIDFATRGRRYTEMLEVMQLLWRREMVEYHGEIFDFPRLRMSPAPTAEIPIYLGGNARVAKRRAARYANGWITHVFRRPEIAGMVAEMHDMLAAEGRGGEPFEIIVPAGSSMDAYRQFSDEGVTAIVNLPTLDEVGPRASLDDMRRYIENYANTFVGRI